MNTKTNVRQKVKCTLCEAALIRVIWNYGRNRPIEIFFCDNACKGEWQRRQREALGFTREWLIDQYVSQEKDANQIGREIGRDGKRVWEWIVDYGIPTRPRGHNVGQLPKDGSSNRGRIFSDAVRARMAEAQQKRIRPERKTKPPKVKKERKPPFLINGVHWLKTVKREDHPSWKGGITPDRQSFYSSLEWKDLVVSVWHRDDAKCQKCGLDHRVIDRSKVKFHIHHIDSFMIKDRRAVLDNLVLLCDKCHRWVHGKKNKDRIFLGRGQKNES